MTSFQNFFRPRNLLGIEIEDFADVLYQLGAVERINVEFGFVGVGEKFRVLDGIDERFAENLHTVFRKSN